MKLKSFGCSFIFGSDLKDNVDKYTCSQFTWPALLANDIGAEYQCHAVAGSGNLQILEHILNQITPNSDDLFVIGWTWIDRFDYYDPYYINDQHTHNPWTTVLPNGQGHVTETYYKRLHSEYKDKLTSLVYVKTAIDALKQNNIRYVMTYMDRLLFDQHWHMTPGVAQLQSYAEPHMTLFDNRTFLEWSSHHDYAESALWHPLEDAHMAAFELIKSYNLV